MNSLHRKPQSKTNPTWLKAAIIQWAMAFLKLQRSCYYTKTEINDYNILKRAYTSSPSIFWAYIVAEHNGITHKNNW